MAVTPWGKVYYNDNYAGELRQEPGGRCVFTYDAAYLEAGRPDIARTLPRQSEPQISEQGLHPFFDNLIAEGWLRNAQARALKTDPNSRFALLLAFGHDCAGAVSVIDPAPPADIALELGDPTAAAAIASRASLSGVQPKLLAVRDGRRFRPARGNETSRFIAKLPSGTLRDLIENEYLTTLACRALMPDDKVVSLQIAEVEGVEGRALLVERFDRLPSGARVHFEEFNQLLGRRSGEAKYEAAYDDLAQFMRKTPGCSPVDTWRLFRRVLVCFLAGNTDAHLKNFAMFHTPEGLRLTPAYDLVAAGIYREYRQLALAVGNASNLTLEALRPKHLIGLAGSFALEPQAALKAIDELGARRAAAEKAVLTAADQVGADGLGKAILEMMEARWNGTFALTGRFLSKKQSADDAG